MDIFEKISEKNNLDIYEYRIPKESFNSNVRIGEGYDKNYIIKILLDEMKRDNEKRYLDYLEDKIDVPNILVSDTFEGMPYNIISYIDGENLSDLEINKKNKNIIYSLGVILAKLHRIPLLDNEKKEWIEYINNYLLKAFKSLNEYVNNNLELYMYLSEQFKIIQNNLDLVNTHLDFRPGNIIYTHKPYIIDLESIRCGDSVFDFVKMSRLLNKKNFDIFLEGYQSIRPLSTSFLEKLKFYRLFDAYTSINWCVLHNAIPSEYYHRNMNAIKKEFKR